MSRLDDQERKGERRENVRGERRKKGRRGVRKGWTPGNRDLEITVAQTEWQFLLNRAVGDGPGLVWEPRLLPFHHFPQYKLQCRGSEGVEGMPVAIGPKWLLHTSLPLPCH